MHEQHVTRSKSLDEARAEETREQPSHMGEIAAANVEAKRQEEKSLRERISLVESLAEKERRRRIEEDEAAACALQFTFICDLVDQELVEPASLATAAIALENQILRNQSKHNLTFKKHMPDAAPTIAASLAAPATQLDRQIIRDKLSHRLSRRNTLTHTPPLAASLAATAHQLNQQLLRDRFARTYARMQDPRWRPVPLVRQPAADMAPALQAVARQLEQQLIADRLTKHLQNRFSFAADKYIPSSSDWT